MKKFFIAGIVAVLIIITMAFFAVTRLISHQFDSNYEILMKRTTNLANNTQNYFLDFVDETDYSFQNNNYNQLLKSKNYDTDMYRNLRRFFVKYQDMLLSLEITDGNYKRQINKVGHNQIEIMEPEKDSTSLVSIRTWQTSGRAIIYTFPVFSDGNKVISNVRFTISLNDYMLAVLKEDNISRDNWIFFTDSKRIIETQTFSSRYTSPNPISIDNLPSILWDINRGLAGLGQGTIITGKYKIPIIYAYKSVIVFNQSYSVIYGMERTKIVSDIYNVIWILSALFLLIMAIAIFLFIFFIRTLRRGEEKLVRIQTAVDNASDLIVITDMKHQPIFVNKAYMNIFGNSIKDRTDVINAIITDEQVRQVVFDRIDHNQSWNGEIEINNKYEEKTTCLLRANIIKDKDNHSLGIMFMATDIAERKKAERMKNEFISTVSHELRTPLTSIRGSLGLIRGGVAGEVPQQAQKLIDIAYTNSERLVRLINDILDIEKIEAGKMEFQMKRQELLPIIEKSIEMMRNYANQFNVSIKFNRYIPGIESYVDVDRLEQVLVNLISNAAKFSSPGSCVELDMKILNPSTVRISVIDQGMGIPDEFRSMIFKKFAQADSSDSKAKGGTGLGLSISKAIIDKFGGKIDFDTVIDKGTTFFFDLPITQDVEAESIDAEDDTPRILIIEDDADIASLLKIILADAGYKTSIAYTAEEAIKKLNEAKFAAITLDLLLPDQPGLELVQVIRENEKNATIPIIVVSAVADQQKQQFLGGFDIVDWIQKPIDISRLKRVLQQALHPRGKDQYTILHVEDDKDNIEIVAQILKDSARLVPAFTLQDAKDKVRNSNFDLIILDVNLPDGYGMDLIPHLHKCGKQSIPVLIFSATETAGDVQKFVAAALVKSKTNNEELVDVIHSILNLNRHREG